MLFVIQMKDIYEFRPNDVTHKACGDALRRAQLEGVELLAYDCIVTPESIAIDKPVRIITERYDELEKIIM